MPVLITTLLTCDRCKATATVSSTQKQPEPPAGWQVEEACVFCPSCEKAFLAYSEWTKVAVFDLYAQLEKVADTLPSRSSFLSGEGKEAFENLKAKIEALRQ